MEWTDVDWAAERITIHRPKTEHHPNGAARIIPLSPELRPYLEAVWEPGARYVINRHRDHNVNLRTQFERIIKRARVESWPRLFQNLRASRETELAKQFPLHVVCYWIGNSAPVVQKHYLQVTEEDFQAALQPGAESGAKSGASTGSKEGTTEHIGQAEKPENHGKQAFFHGFYGLSRHPLGETNTTSFPGK